MNKKDKINHIYFSDSRYEKVWEQMKLLGIQDVSTKRQDKNGTIVWRLPIKNEWKNGSFIEVGSFKSGYVRNNNSCYSNYQLNKRCDSEPEYYPDYEWKTLDNGDYTQVKTGKYKRFTTRTCKLISIEIDRLEYLISYCLKNYYIKHANFIADGEYIHKSQSKWELERAKDERLTNCGHHDRINALECSNETWKNLADEWKERFENLDDTSDSQEVMIKSLENKLNEANDTLPGDCKYIYPEGRYDKIRNLEEDLKNMTEARDYYKDKYKKLDDFYEASADFNKSMDEGMKDRISELKDSLDSSDYRIKDLEKIINTLRDSNKGYKTREKDLENKLDTIQRIADHG